MNKPSIMSATFGAVVGLIMLPIGITLAFVVGDVSDPFWSALRFWGLFVLVSFLTLVLQVGWPRQIRPLVEQADSLFGSGELFGGDGPAIFNRLMLHAFVVAVTNSLFICAVGSLAFMALTSRLAFSTGWALFVSTIVGFVVLPMANRYLKP